MIPYWATLAVIAGLFSNVGNFLFRFILRDRENPVAFAWFSEILRFSMFATVAIFDWHFVATGKSVSLVVLIGFVEVFTIYYIVKMHALSHLSLSTLLSRTRLVWVPILAFLFANEKLVGTDYIGIAILFIGISIAVAPRHIVKDQGMKFALISAFLASVQIVLTKMLTPYASIGVINTAAFLPSLFLMPLFMKSPVAQLKTEVTTRLPIKVLSICMFFGANYASTYAYHFGDASKIAAVYYGMMIFAVLAGIIFLNERENIAKKIIGTIVVLVGVVLLS